MAFYPVVNFPRKGKRGRKKTHHTFLPMRCLKPCPHSTLATIVASVDRALLYTVGYT